MYKLQIVLPVIGEKDILQKICNLIKKTLSGGGPSIPVMTARKLHVFPRLILSNFNFQLLHSVMPLTKKMKSAPSQNLFSNISGTPRYPWKDLMRPHGNLIEKHWYWGKVTPLLEISFFRAFHAFQFCAFPIPNLVYKNNLLSFLVPIPIGSQPREQHET